MNRRRLVVIVAVMGLIGSVCAVLYPLVSNYLADQRQEQVLLSVEEQMEGITDQVLDTERKEANAYNRALASYISGNGGVNIDEAAYADRLNMGGDGIMGILTIPRLSVKLPIYHGTGTAVLDKGIGHVYGTSLPVGTWLVQVNGGHPIVAKLSTYDRVWPLAEEPDTDPLRPVRPIPYLTEQKLRERYVPITEQTAEPLTQLFREAEGKKNLRRRVPMTHEKEGEI